MRQIMLVAGVALSLLALGGVGALQPPSAEVEAGSRFPSGAGQTRTPMHPPVSEPVNLAIFGAGLITISLAIRQKSRADEGLTGQRAMLERSEALGSTR